VKEKNGIQPHNLTDKRVSKFNRKDVAVFTFFLFISFIFWYLNSLNNEIESGIRFPVKYINVPKEKLVIDESTVRLNIFLKGTGYSIIKLKLSASRTPINIDLSKVSYKRVPGSSLLNYYIITSGLTKSLSVQLRSECDITSIQPDTLFFRLDKAESEPVKLKTSKRIGDTGN
jgi:hypothetical protein